MMYSEKQVTARVRYWRKRLGLMEYDLRILFGENKDVPPPAVPSATGEDRDTAACYGQPEYIRAALYFDLGKMESDYRADLDTTTPEAYLDATIIHELLHMPVWGLSYCAHLLAKGDALLEEWVRQQEEHTTTRLERIIVRLTQ
jgi:hypothetical protein